MTRSITKTTVEDISFFSYTQKDVEKLKKSLQMCQQLEWLTNEEDLIFQICDELLKNAFKSNYKFLIIWEDTLKRIRASNPEMNVKEANSWLRYAFFSGENELIEKQFKNSIDPEVMKKSIRELIMIENSMRSKKSAQKSDSTSPQHYNIENLLRIRKLSKQLKIQVNFKIEYTGNDLIISVANGSPILERDVKRIQSVRERFRKYYDAGRSEYFFIENIDTSEGGHGLGYALMDSILLKLGLQPSKTLYLLPSGHTIVMLVLPIKHTKAIESN